jgi:hypothetical protein
MRASRGSRSVLHRLWLAVRFVTGAMFLLATILLWAFALTSHEDTDHD